MSGGEITEKQRKTSQTLKGLLPGGKQEDLKIYDDTGAVIGYLRVVDKDLAEDDEVVRLLTDWRIQFREVFFTQFTATAERTRAWLKNTVIPDDGRVLFLILDANKRPIGNYGLCNIAGETAELDNLIRAIRPNRSRFIFYTGVCFLAWIFDTFEVDRILGSILDTNSKSLNHHCSIGFERGETYALTRHEKDSEVYHEAHYDRVPKPGELGVVKITAYRDQFFAKHPWLPRG